MERNLFLKILFKKTLSTIAYLSGIVLLLAVLYQATAYLEIDQTGRILVLACALLLAGLIYYLAVRERPKEDMAKDNPAYAAELLTLLRSGQGKEELKEKIRVLIQRSGKTTLFPLVNDLSYHLGDFSPTTHDYRFRKQVYSYDEGLNHYAGKLENMLATGRFVFDEPIYELYWRWLYYKGDKVEVEYIHSNNVYDKFNHSLFKSIKEGDYYFVVERGYSAFSSCETLKVTEESIRVELERAVLNNDRYSAGKIADRFLGEG